MHNPVAMLLTTLPARSSAWDVVDALVPAWADLALVCLPVGGHLQIAAFAHIDPMQMPALREFQRMHLPSFDDPASLIARVFRNGVSEVLRPEGIEQLEQQITNPAARVVIRALGPRTTLIVPITETDQPTAVVKGVLVTAMSASRPGADGTDLESLASLGRQLGSRLSL